MKIKLFAILTFFSINSFAVDSTYIQCYGVKDYFESRSDLIDKSWGINDENEYIKVEGYWKNNTYNSKNILDKNVYAELKKACKKTLERKYTSTYIDQISYFAANKSVGYEYPILSKKDANNLNKNKFTLDYKKILRYAYASSYVYSIEDTDKTFAFENDNIFKKLMHINNKLEILDSFYAPSGLIALALKIPSENKKEIVIAFKGTSSKRDIIQDIELMFANFIETDQDWQEDAYNFVQKIKNEYKDYTIVLTGHSLGAYTAIDVSVRTSTLARVFSSPATRIIDKYIHMFSNKMHYTNVINFVRLKDPVSTKSGRHNENMVYFPSSSSMLKSHYLTPFINEILKPLYFDSKDEKAQAKYLYIQADTKKGAALEFDYNYWGKNK